VADQGLSGTSLLLLARLLSVPNPDAWLGRLAGQPDVAFIYLRQPDGLLAIGTSLFGQVGHYPWGWDVEPDEY